MVEKRGMFIHELFEHQQRQTPHLSAVYFGGMELTYTELNRKADLLAYYLIKTFPKIDIIGISSTRGLEMIIGVIAILKAGKAYLPLDPGFPKDRLVQMIIDSGINCCLCLEAERFFFGNLIGGFETIATDKQPGDKIEIKRSESSSLAYVLYTSGSSGKPKGVAMGHASLVNLINWQKKNSTAGIGSRTLQFAPLIFDVSFQEIFATLTGGGCLVLIEDDIRLDPLLLLKFIEDQSIQRIFLPFVALQFITEAADSNHFFPYCLSEVITAGEQLKLTPQIVRFFSVIPNCSLYNQYGPTETHVVTALKLEGNPSSWSVLPSIGKPIENTEIFILDEKMNLLSDGDSGEICVRGISLADGYLNQQGLTAEKFICLHHSFTDGERIYKTGDIGRKLGDGSIEFLGRHDDQVKIRGYRVEPGEIELLLCNQQGIKQAVVIAREDHVGEKKLVAYLVPSNKSNDTITIRHSIKTKLPDYMMPSAFVWLDHLPRTLSGKVDKKRLPKPELKRPDFVHFKAPSTKIEKDISSCWSDLLQLDRVGLNDNFFELGGNSLLALKIVERLKREHNYYLPITKIYQKPTLSAIAAYLNEENQSKSDSLKTRINSNGHGRDIAVIAMAGRFPGANTIDALWDLLREGREAISFFSSEELDESLSAELKNNPDYVKARGIIEGADKFDPTFFGINPVLADLMDPQHRIFMEIAWEALENSGYPPSKFPGTIGVFAGSGNNTYYLNNVQSNTELISEVGRFQVMTANEKDYLASRTAYALNLKGPAVSVQSACSTSLLAIAEAVESIRSGQCDMALAGGVSISVPIKSGYIYSEGAMNSRDGHNRSFDAEAAGTVFSDGAGVVLLKRIDDAIKDRDTIFSIIKGVGLNNDGGSKGSFSAPSAEGQAGAIQMAIRDAGVNPSHISYIEAHGTATPLGDPIEIEGLNLAFGEQERKQFCALGSIKSNIGHCTAAAGVAGFIKTTLALYYKKIPASINYNHPSPHINFEKTPFYVNTSFKDWRSHDARKAGVSSFGVGGTNVHVLLEEYNSLVKIDLVKPDAVYHHQLICISAKSSKSLDIFADKLIAYINSNDEVMLADVAYTLNTSREDFNVRRFIIAGDKEEFIRKLRTQDSDKGKNILSDRYSTLAEIGQSWINGFNPDWKTFYRGQNRKIVHLPNYAFEKKRCWVDAVLPLRQPDFASFNGNENISIQKIRSKKAVLIDRLKGILKNASGIEVEAIRSDMNFVEIGFDSLLLTQFALNLKKEFEVPISFRQLNENINNLELLAGYLTDKLPTEITREAQKLNYPLKGLNEDEISELERPFGASTKIENKSALLSKKQNIFLDGFIKRYNQKTNLSKVYAQEHRSYMADPRVVSGFRPLTKEIVYPIVVNKSKGSRIWDLDGNEYVDALNGFGSNFFGYQPEFITKALHKQIEKGYELGPQHELAGKVSKLISEFTDSDRVALCNTGSEAVLGAMRLARTVTGRSTIVAFSGSYHGIVDEVIVRGTKSGKSLPASPGIMPEAVQNMLILDYGTMESLAIIRERVHELAAVLVEPIQSRRPEFQPVEFLRELRKITIEAGTALIFDEVITGFRMHMGGVQAMFGIKADISIYGKVVAAGLPMGIIAGRELFMDALDGGFWEYGNNSIPGSGVTYFAGTFVRHPLALATSYASLKYMKATGPILQESINEATKALADRLNLICSKKELPIFVAQFGSLWKIKFKEEILFSELLFSLMREKGIHIWDGFPCFLTESHSKTDVNFIIEKFEDSANELIEAGFFVDPKIIRVVPAIEPQNEIWISCLLGGEDASRSYNESVSLRLEGDFNLAAMKQALLEITNRHEALRSTFSEDGKDIYIHKESDVTLRYEDLSGKSVEEKTKFISIFTKENALQVFELVKGPLFRTALFKLNGAEHYLTVTAHHIICDGWSLGIILQDLSNYYSSFIKNEEPGLDIVPSFGNYAISQRQFSETREYKLIEQYWIERYKSIPVLDMPTDFLRPHERSYNSRREDFLLNPELVAAIKKIGNKSGCTLVTTLMVAFEVFLNRLTGQPEIILGIPASQQSNSGLFGLVGHCVNLLPLRSSPKEMLGFSVYLELRKSEILNDYENQRITFGSLLKILQISRDSSRIPLVPVVFSFDLGLDNGVKFADLKHKLYYNPREFENFEIFLNLSGTEKSLIFEWSYNTQLFKSSTIHGWMHAFESMLETIVEFPLMEIKNISLVSSKQLNEQLKIWSETEVSYPKEKSLHQIIGEAAKKYSLKTAIHFGDQTLSYQELEGKSNQLAHLLTDKGIKPNDIVGVALNRSLELVITLIAILKSGAAYLPLDPLYPKERVDFMMNDASAKMLVTSKQYASLFQCDLKELIIENAFENLQAFSNGETGITVPGNSLAYLLYTSGSTGLPKGVMVEHRNLVNLLCSMQKFPGIKCTDRLLAITTISFDLSGLELFLPLISGAELVLANNEEQKNGHILLEKLVQKKISIIQATPATYKLMLDAGWGEQLDLKILSGGEALSKVLADKLIIRGKRLYNLYGPTETTIHSTCAEILSTDEFITVGRPIDNTKIYILDTYGNILPDGIKGEIYIGGDGVSRGYLNRPELQSQRFIPDPFVGRSNMKMYRTGDIGKYLDDGRIQHFGRNDHQIKIHGFRIEPGEIEFKLNCIEDIKESIVLVQENNLGEPQLVAYVVTNQIQDRLKAINQWRSDLKTTLPLYMIPNDFIILTRFSLTPNGKIDLNLIGSADITKEKNTLQPPINELDKKIAAIWSSFLGIDPIGMRDDFFVLGGHSLIAAQVMRELEKETGYRIPITALFEAPTIEKLSRMLGQTEKLHSWKSLVPIKPSGNKPPLYIVHGSGLTVLVFHKLATTMDSDQPVYGLQARGLNGIDEPFDNLEKIASYYISEIFEQNPSGPYNLAGYSFGGIVAFEMAKQLIARGKKVNMLAIFDTFADNSPNIDRWVPNLFKKFKKLFLDIKFNLRLLKKDPIDTIKYRFINRKYKLMRLLSRGGIIKEISGQEKYLRYSEKINRKHDIAYAKYDFTPYNGSIDLFRVKKRMYYLDDPIYFGWKPFASKGLNIHEIPGDHVTFLHSPNVQELSKILSSIIEERNTEKDYE
jgi:amino acid adenylation domain-containing protein